MSAPFNLPAMVSRYHPALLTAIAVSILWFPVSGNPLKTAQTQNEAVEWKEFSSPEGRFSVLMPGTPVSRGADRHTQSGTVKFHENILKLPDASFSAGYLDYNDSSDEAEILRNGLNEARDEVLRSNQSSRLIYERELKVGTFSGREFMVQQNPKLITIVQTYVVHRRLYQFAVQLPAEAAFNNGKPTDRLLDRTEYFNSSASKFLAHFEVPEISETMDDFERTLREVQRKHPGVITVVASPDADPKNAITGGVLNGRAVHLVTPVYPSIARSSHAYGKVSVQVLIDSEGNVAAARAVDGHPLLRGAAEKAARESKFTATTFEGKLVNVNGIIIYNFVTQ